MAAKRIERLIRVAGLAEMEAGRRLADSAATLAAKQAEIARLRHYLDEHRALARSTAAVDGARWTNAQAFGERLLAAIDAGEIEEALLAARHDDDVERWRMAHRRHAALRDLAVRQAADGRREDERREQTELDDRSIRTGK